MPGFEGWAGPHPSRADFGTAPIIVALMNG